MTSCPDVEALAAGFDRGAGIVYRASGRSLWRDVARPEQLPPESDWFTWLILAGRGWGKSRCGAETVAEWARTYPGLRVALVAITFADGRDTMVEGESGLLSVLDPAELRGGSIDSAWNRSLGELFLANGSRFKIYSSERPRQLRGPQHHVAWGDEACQWLDCHKGTATDTTWSNLLMGLRLRPHPDWPPGFRPRAVVTTTPRPVPLLKVRGSVLAREPHKAGIIQRPDTVTVRGRTTDNLDNLADTYRKSVIDPLLGTSLGRQELDAEIIEDVEGAFLAREVIERTRLLVGEVPVLAGTVVSVDPAVTAEDTSDETGIVVVAADNVGHGYVLDDRSLRASPDGWGRRVWETVLAWKAGAVVVEDNQGGDMVEHVLATTWSLVVRERARRGQVTPARPPIVRVHPTRGQGKWVRALPVQALAEQDRVHFVRDADLGRDTAELEDQATSWTGVDGEESPDRVDAMVHGLTWLLFPGQRADKRRAPGRDPSGRWRGGGGRR